MREPVYRHYPPTEHDVARIKRLTRDRGHYNGCRYYEETTDRTFKCTRHNHRRKTCQGCSVCPNCGGMLFTAEVKERTLRSRKYIDCEKSCAICGATVEENYVMLTDNAPDSEITLKPINRKPRVKNVNGRASVRGSRNVMAELKEEDIPTIRQMLADNVPHRTIAKKFGVTRGPISAIAAGRTWRHVE